MEKWQGAASEVWRSLKEGMGVGRDLPTFDTRHRGQVIGELRRRESFVKDQAWLLSYVISRLTNREWTLCAERSGIFPNRRREPSF